MQANHCFKDLTLMISDVIDQVGLDDTQHGKRVGYMAWQCADHLEIEGFTAEDLLVAGLLHDIGVSSSREHELLVTLVDWEKSSFHCAEGVKLLENLPFYHKYIDVVRYHHTHWDKLQPLPISNSSKQAASLIFLMDRVDALLFQYLAQNPDDEAIHAREFIHTNLSQLDGFFYPPLVEAFVKASTIDAFWFNLEKSHLSRYLQHLDFEKSITLDLVSTEAVALILAAAVDAKSPFTAEHSLNVGALAYYIAKQLELDEARCQQLKIAGYLHDIGKLHIPDNILEKEGPLNAKETVAMHRHGFEAQDILERVTSFKEIALWACQHHEFLDGSGYPYQLKGDQIPFESRILTIADIFQALAQKRPYRDSMPVNQVMQILTELAEQGKIDTQIMAFVQDHQQQCWQLATA